jgi:hypothetical protein
VVHQPSPDLPERLAGRRGDSAKAIQAVLRLYEVLGRPAPRAVVWLDSPLAGVIAHACLLEIYGEALFYGDDPQIIAALMPALGKWQRTTGGRVFATVRAYSSPTSTKTSRSRFMQLSRVSPGGRWPCAARNRSSSRAASGDC